MIRSARAILFLWSIPVSSQAPATPLSFEVADVKVNKSGEVRMAVDFQAGGRLDMHNVPLKVMIIMAYHVRADALSGGPGWLESERFDVVAKAAQTTSPDEMRRMLQTLLAERFKLAIHRDQKVMPAFGLMLGKSGPKFHLSEAALLTDQRCVPGEGAPSQRHVVCRHQTMAVLADQLQELSPRDFDVPIVDQTGLTGAYDFKLDWVPAARPLTTASTDAPPTDALPGPTMFDAVEGQLGLKLERKKLPLPIIVIDHVERVPVEN
jgi:uncharacterized protein (TIGR03435 family)